MERVANIPHCMHPVLIECLSHLHPRVLRRAPAQPAPRPRRRQVRPGPFLSQPPLKLRQGQEGETLPQEREG